MCTTTPTYSRIIRGRGVLVIGLIVILILASIAFIVGLILGTLSSTTPDGYQADRVPVVRNLVIPVPTPAVAEIKPVTSQISTASSVELLEPSLIPVPVPTLAF